MGSRLRQVRNFGDIDRVVRSDLDSARFCLSSDVRNVLHHGRARRTFFFAMPVDLAILFCAVAVVVYALAVMVYGRN